MKKINLTRGRVAVVDDEDFDMLSKYKWTFDGRYAIRAKIHKPRQINISMHREVMNCPTGVEIDHINRDGLDNRKSNLRFCTSSQNKANKPPKPNTASGFKGVFLDKRNGAWYSQIMVDGVRIHVGTFDSPLDAACAYNEHAKRLFGEFAWLNDLSVGVTPYAVQGAVDFKHGDNSK